MEPVVAPEHDRAVPWVALAVATVCGPAIVAMTPDHWAAMWLLAAGAAAAAAARRAVRKPSQVWPVEALAEIPADLDSVRQPRDFFTLSPAEFEQWCAALLRWCGFTDVQVVGRAGDRGSDIVAVNTRGEKVVVQCKLYHRRVSTDPILRLQSAAILHQATRAIVMAPSGFTAPCHALANDLATQGGAQTILADAASMLAAVQRRNLWAASRGVCI